MRISALAVPAIAAKLAAAYPAPQEIDLDMVLAAPDPTYTLTAQSVSYDTASIVAEATAVSSVSVDVSDVLSSTAVVQGNAKRAAATPTVCQPQTYTANAAPTYSPDSADNFLQQSYFPSAATNAAVPAGWTKTFENKQGSSSAYGYMGYDQMSSYDVAECANRCNSKDGCVSFNIYFERDPTVNPSDNQNDGCYNPPSATVIKCAYWGGPVDETNLGTNNGQYRAGFLVKIAGSNGYVTNQLPTVDGYQKPVPYAKNAINAPYDAQGYNTFMGSKIFTVGPWDASSCAKYCDSQTLYNTQHPAKDGTPPKVCKFFNTYVLTSKSQDGTVKPQGQYCALYTEAWPAKYATNGGQWRGTDQYLVSYSFGYAKNPTPSDIDPVNGDALGAVYQAIGDIKWGTLQPYCSTLLGYTTPVVTVSKTTTVTPLNTATASATVTVTVTRQYKRDATDDVAAATTSADDSTVTSDVLQVLDYSEAVSSALSEASASATDDSAASTTAVEKRKRAVATSTSTPADLKKYPATVVSSACSSQATPVTQTSTSTVLVTATAAPITTTTTVTAATASATICVPGVSSFRLKISAPGSPADGKYVSGPDADKYYLGAGAGYYSQYNPLTFSLNTNNGRLTSTKTSIPVVLDDFTNPGAVAFYKSASSYPLLSCAVDATTSLFGCSASNPNANKFYREPVTKYTQWFVGRADNSLSGTWQLHLGSKNSNAHGLGQLTAAKLTAVC